MPRFSPQRLRQLREAAGLSRDDVARQVGKTTSTVVKYEQATITPSVGVLGALARVYGVPVGELFDADDPDDPVIDFARQVRELVDTWPDFTPGQKSRLRVILRGVA
jgi:transcriptional regulator with XRE-family HTH domain